MRMHSFSRFDWLVGVPIALGVAVVIVLTALDMLPPLRNVHAYADAPVRQGGILKLHWNYDRMLPARVKHVHRTVTCDGGGAYVVQPVNAGDNTVAWPSGKDAKATILIRLPKNIPVGNCWYTGNITYKRIILPDLSLKMPPEDIVFQVVP